MVGAINPSENVCCFRVVFSVVDMLIHGRMIMQTPWFNFNDKPQELKLGRVGLLRVLMVVVLVLDLLPKPTRRGSFISSLEFEFGVIGGVIVA